MDKTKKGKLGKKSAKIREESKPAAKTKVEELTDDLQHLQAEFENYKKYVEKQKVEYALYSKADVIGKLLPIMDSFEEALKHKNSSENFVKGVELLFTQLTQLFEQEGLRPIESKGKMVNPHYHEVMLTENSDKPEETILEELQKGYMMGDKVLRHAKVKASKGKVKQ